MELTKWYLTLKDFSLEKLADFTMFSSDLLPGVYAGLITKVDPTTTNTTTTNTNTTTGLVQFTAALLIELQT